MPLLMATLLWVPVLNQYVCPYHNTAYYGILLFIVVNLMIVLVFYAMQ
jgi:hypothetical protein